jgi:hypothetical protein
MQTEVYRSDEALPLLGTRLSCFSIADHFAGSHLSVSLRRFWQSVHDTFRSIGTDSVRVLRQVFPELPERQRLPGFSSGLKSLMD